MNAVYTANGSGDSFDITWAVPHRLLVVTLPTHLDLEGWQSLDTELQAQLDASQIQADVVINADRLIQDPANTQVLQTVLPSLCHANLNRLLLIGSNPQIQSRIEEICSSAGREVRFSPSLIEAMAYLRNLYEAQVQ